MDYNNYRPQTFNDVVGQKYIVREMKNRSKKIEFPQSMLFYGHSGSGKSTMAFIVAKMLNCENPVMNKEGYYEPCDKCDSCEDIISKRFNRDVWYWDASKMGKREIKLMEEITFRCPMYDKNRIFIVDEAHLLASEAAKGSMLMMLENLLDRIYVILCTTSLNQFKDKAFQSRLVKYNFRAIESTEISDILIRAANDKELPMNIDEFYNHVIPAISRKANGNIREGFEILDRCIGGELFTMDEAIEALDLTLKEINGK